VSRRQSHQHGEPPIAGERSGHDLPAAAVGAVVADIVEQQRRSVGRALRQPRHGAELDIPVDLGVDALKLPAASSALIQSRMSP